MTVRAVAARTIKKHGTTVTLSRASEGTSVSLKAKRIGGGLADMGNGAAQQTFRIKVGTAELLASAWTVKAPKRKDSILIGGRTRTVEDVRPLSDAGTTALYELEVAG